MPCGCGIRNVPSDEDGVPEAEADEEQDNDAVLQELTRQPDRLSSKPNRGKGNVMGRSRAARTGRSFRGSVGGSSFSSQSGVPGRLQPCSCCRLLRDKGVSTSQGMMRGRECLVVVALAVPSPELSVESRDTLRLGRLNGCNSLGVCDVIQAVDKADEPPDELDVWPTRRDDAC